MSADSGPAHWVVHLRFVGTGDHQISEQEDTKQEDGSLTAVCRLDTNCLFSSSGSGFWQAVSSLCSCRFFALLLKVLLSAARGSPLCRTRFSSLLLEVGDDLTLQVQP